MIRKLTTLVFALCLVASASIGGVEKTRGALPEFRSFSPDTSAPDAWGYTWVRSNEPGGPTFNWVDISTVGTQLTGVGDDVNLGPFPIGFDFPWYWYSTNIFRIGSNGYIVLRNDGANWASPFSSLPTTAANTPKDILAILGGDLDPSVAASNPRIYYWSNGVDSLVVSFIDITEWQQVTNPNLKHTFQVILNKQDSSVTYQYGRQQGQYNATNNNVLSIGWQNVSGQIGMSYTFSNTPPHALMPDSGLAIKIKRTVNTGLQVTDAGILGGLNSGNLGKIIAMGAADTVKCVAKNYGTVALNNVRVTYAITRALQPTFRDTIFIPSLAPAEELLVSFPRLFTPPVVGAYSASFTAFVSGDIGPGNNTRVAEITAASFTPGTNTLVAYETATVGGSTGWLGGGGFGVSYELPVAVRIESLYVRVGAVTTQPMRVEILSLVNGAPGDTLAFRTVNATANSLNGISFVSDSIRLPDGKFFIGARGDMQFSYETTPPIAFRTWEYTNGYAPYRSRDAQDIIMRASVRVEGGGTPAVTVSPTSITQAVNEGDSIDVPVRIRNVGTAPLTWSASTVTAPMMPAGNNNVAEERLQVMGSYERAPRLMTDMTYPEVTYGPPLEGLLTSLNESFEGTTFPPAGWVKLNPDGGPGWNRQVVGTTPVPGWQGGVITAPPGGGSAVAFCTWNTGGATSNDQWLVTPQLTGVSANDSLKFWMRWWPNTYDDTVQIRISTTTPTVGAFTILVANIGFGTGSTVDTGWIAYGFRLGDFVAPGSNIYIGFRERVTDNFNDGASISLDLVQVTEGVPVVEWLRLVGATSGTIAPGDSATLTARLYARTAAMLLDTTFQGNIQITTNAPANPTVNVPVTLTVITDVPGEGEGLPADYVLHQNYPNPFNPTTEIRYALPSASFVTLKVYTLLGQEVATMVNADQIAGNHVVRWDGRTHTGAAAGSGVYFYRMEARAHDGGAFVGVKRMLLLK